MQTRLYFSAAHLPQDIAFIDKSKSYSYTFLFEKVKELRQELSENRISEKIVIIQGTFGIEVFAMFLAVLLEKGIVVFLPKREPNSQLKMELTQAEYLISFSQKQGWQYQKLHAPITDTLLLDFRKRQKAGFVLFTSGSSGKPKAVLHSFEKFITSFKKLSKRHTVLLLFSFDHIGGMNTVFRVYSSGGTVVIPEKPTPKEVGACVERYQVDLLPTTPTLLNAMMIQDIGSFYSLNSLKIITFGAERTSAALLLRLRNYFPKVQLKQTFGLTETGIIPSKSPVENYPWLELKGLEGKDWKIENDTLYLKSKGMMLGYLHTESRPDEWFCTEDKVKREGDYLQILGRQSEVINVGGDKVYPAEIESVLLSMDFIDEAIVFGLKNDLMGEVVAAEIVIKKEFEYTPQQWRSKIKRACLLELARYKVPVVIGLKKNINITTRGKKAISTR